MVTVYSRTAEPISPAPETVNVNSPAADGIPEIAPVAPFSVRPSGSVAPCAWRSAAMIGGGSMARRPG